MAVCLRLPRPARTDSLELPSAGLLAVAAASLLAVCQWGGHKFSWASVQVLGCAGLCLAATAAFCWRQGRAREPFFPTRLLRHPTLRAVTLLQLTTGLGMAAGTIYLTLDLQLVRGSTAIATGLQLLPVAAGLGLGSLLGQRIARSGRPSKASIIGGSAVSALAWRFRALLAGGPDRRALRRHGRVRHRPRPRPRARQRDAARHRRRRHGRRHPGGAHPPALGFPAAGFPAVGEPAASGPATSWPATSGATCARSRGRSAACSRCRRGCGARSSGTARAAGRGRRGRVPPRARAGPARRARRR
jgi:hypothetical protein